ncbi:MAG: B-box zinc finger protein [Acidobacteriaceae bacterium]
MNCANHPDTPVAAYCQFCGKPLCDRCIHRVNNIVSCEPCLEARLGAASRGAYTVNVGDGKGFHYTAGGPIPAGSVQPNWTTEPWIAFLLGWIPGVGAMYNGQFAKALAHVVIFALLVDFCHYNGFLGIAVAAWVIYQVFDAYQTAVARRHGQPLPNPLGLNDIGQWFGARATPTANPWVGHAGNSANENQNAGNAGVPPMGNVETGTGFASAPGYTPAPGFVPPYVPPAPPPIPPQPADPFYAYGPGGQWCGYGGNRGIHTGAVVLIILGVLFLLGNMGILSGHWVDRGWPLILIGIGVWMVIRHSQRQPPAGGTR